MVFFPFDTRTVRANSTPRRITEQNVSRSVHTDSLSLSKCAYAHFQSPSCSTASSQTFLLIFPGEGTPGTSPASLSSSPRADTRRGRCAAAAPEPQIPRCSQPHGSREPVFPHIPKPCDPSSFPPNRSHRPLVSRRRRSPVGNRSQPSGTVKPWVVHCEY